MQIKQSNKAGFTLVEIMIVVAIIGLLAAIAIPNFVKARNTAQTNACIANLKQVDGAVQQWALEKKKAASDNPTSSSAEVTAFLKSGLPLCPGGGTIALPSAVSNSPTCTLSASGHSL